MRYSLSCAAALTAAALFAGVAAPTYAAGTLIYGMESGGAFAPDGFTPNGGGTIAKVTGLGVTQGTFAMEDTLLPTDAGFTGALTTAVLPAAATAPGVKGYSFDLTLPVAYTGSGATAAAVGITLFQSGGIPHQSDQSFLIPTGVTGTFNVVLDNLTENATGHPPLVPEFYPGGLTQSGFQFFVIKGTGLPLDFIIDNVQAIPEPTAAIGAAGLALAGLATDRRRQRCRA